MKIIMASVLNIDEDMNGVTVCIKELQSALKKQDNQVELVSPYTYGANSLGFRLLGLFSYFYHKFNYSFLILIILFIKMMLIYLQARKQKNEYKFFHAHDVVSAASLLMAAGKSNISLLTTHFRDYPWEEFAEAGYVKSNSIPFKILRYFSTRVLKHKGLRKLAVSESNFGMVQRLDPDPANPKAIIYSGLDVENRPSVLNDKAKYLINVGSLNARKNQIFLIDILAELEKQGLQVPLVLVGPEDRAEKEKIMQRIHKLGIKSQVHFLGKQSEKQARILIARARLYLHTSLQESFGRTLIESINLHTPVLALDYKAVHEIIPEDAIISRTWDIARTGRFVKKFLTDKSAREKLQKKQFEHFLKHFTEEKMVSDYTDFLQGYFKTPVYKNNIFTLDSKQVDPMKNDRIQFLYKKYAQGGFWFARLRESLKGILKVAVWNGVLKLALAVKRAMDIIGALFVLVLFSPLYLLTAVAILIEDGRPIFYSQVRVATRGRLFRMYKFRSMYNNADQMKEKLQSDNMTGDVIFKMKKDPRITRVGRIIRKLSIDEMPQLWNVLKGDLSLVGPRPPLPVEVKRYSLWDQKRLEIKPGLTCIWQVSGRSDINFESQVNLDIDYIKQRSLKFDLLLLLKTIPAVLSGKGAY